MQKVIDAYLGVMGCVLKREVSETDSTAFPRSPGCGVLQPQPIEVISFNLNPPMLR